SDDRLPFDTMCFCNVVCQVEGINFRDAPTCERAELPEIDPHPVAGGPVLGVRLMPTRNREPTGRWLPGVYRVVLEGDQILGFKKTKVPSRVKPEETMEVYPALDGNHLGPGLVGPRSRLVNHPELGKRRCPTGDLAEGGRFLSWFRLE
ncbi:MAG TPA: hypothetical protein VNT02_03355, partial [Burkholderiales bacterium]|nr:hypothetical protein [Burkholderiales bacterium]